MKVSGNAIVLTNGKFDTKSAKTAHGLIRGSKRFTIKSVIDDKFHAKYVHINKHGNISISNTKSNISVFKNVESFLATGIDVNYCIIGVASAGGILPEEMRDDVILALNNNISIVNI